MERKFINDKKSFPSHALYYNHTFRRRPNRFAIAFCYPQAVKRPWQVRSSSNIANPIALGMPAALFFIVGFLACSIVTVACFLVACFFGYIVPAAIVSVMFCLSLILVTVIQDYLLSREDVGDSGSVLNVKPARSFEFEQSKASSSKHRNRASFYRKGGASR